MSTHLVFDILLVLVEENGISVPSTTTLRPLVVCSHLQSRTDSVRLALHHLPICKFVVDRIISYFVLS